MKRNIIELIEGQTGAGLVQLLEEIRRNGIKGSVARERNLSPIHKAPVRIQNLSVSLDLFETGIKVVDLLTPYKKGGKIGLFGGAGVGNCCNNGVNKEFSNRTLRVEYFFRCW